MNPSYKYSNNSDQTQPIKIKKDKNSLHNLPKLDKTQLYFNSHHTQTPLTYKITKTNASDTSTGSKPYFLNNNLKTGLSKPKSSKEQNKSITNFLDITITANYSKDYKTVHEGPSKAPNQENFEIKSGECKFTKLYPKQKKNSYGNSMTLEKNFVPQEKELRPSLYESSSIKTKEYFHQAVNRGKLQKNDKKQPQHQDLEVILTEASENNMNEFNNAETKQAILTLFTPETFLGPKNATNFNNANKFENNNKQKKEEIQEKNKNEIAGLSEFIIKNKDTGFFF